MPGNGDGISGLLAYQPSAGQTDGLTVSPGCKIAIALDRLHAGRDLQETPSVEREPYLGSLSDKVSGA